MSITGGGSGIGASMVEHFSAQGSSVAFVDIKVEESLALAAGIEGAGGHKPLFIPCDLVDIGRTIKRVFGGRLARTPAADGTSAVWYARAAKRKRLIDRYLWDQR